MDDFKDIIAEILASNGSSHDALWKIIKEKFNFSSEDYVKMNISQRDKFLELVTEYLLILASKDDNVYETLLTKLDVNESLES